ncbi:MAG: nickel-binding protein [Acidimicrobiia bacterium]
MALFIIERGFAEQLDVAPELIQAVEDYNGGAGLRWLFSFLSADGKKGYCLYEAPNADALRAQAASLGLPADAIVEVSEVNPAVLNGGAGVTSHAMRF